MQSTHFPLAAESQQQATLYYSSFNHHAQGSLEYMQSFQFLASFACNFVTQAFQMLYV